MSYKIVTILLFTVLMVGCSSSDPVNTVRDTNIDFFLSNINGDDLLDPDHPNAITEHNTDLFYLEDEEKKRVYEGNLDHPEMFFVSDEKISDKYFMRVFPNIIRGQDKATTYIEFEDSTVDTIEVEYEARNNFTAVRKVWYNQELKWDVNGNEPRRIEIKKDLTND